MKRAGTTAMMPTALNKAKFKDTDNPRHLSAIAALLKRTTSRKKMDGIAGCANTPQIISDIKQLGLEIKYECIAFIDRDGCKCCPDVYHMTNKGRRGFWAWNKEVA